MEEWKEYKIGDIAKTNISQYSLSENWKAIQYLDTGSITKNHISSIEEYFDNNDLPSRARRKVKHGDIVYSCVRPNLCHYGYMDNPPSNLLVSTGFAVITAASNLADARYLYYFLTQNNIVQSLHAIGEQAASTYPSIKPSDIEDLSISLPPLLIQRKIVAILKSLDDKIEINRRINENLEQQVQALFKSWFVDFEPFHDKPFVESELGMIPVDWEIVSLADLMNYSGGSQPSASEFIEEAREGYVRFVQIRDYASDSHITYIPVSRKNKICEERDIMIARYGASLGRICYGIDGAYNVALAKVLPLKDYYIEFLRCYLNTRVFYEGINQKGNRAVQAGFNKSDIQSFKLPFPKDENLVRMFNQICSSFFEKRLLLDKESRVLSNIRDTLLPRLMSGELEIQDIEESL